MLPQPARSIMYLNRIVRLMSLSRTVYPNIRRSSTTVGKSGRVYVQGEMLWFDPQARDFSIFKAESGKESFVFKRVSRPSYNLILRHAADFAGSRRLRLHVDCNDEECLLVYPYFKTTLLQFIREESKLPEESQLSEAERKKIMRHVGEAIQELHSKGWIHINIKPDSILVSWICDEEGRKTITDVALGDFDIAYKPERGEPHQTPFPIGNVIWRSPEGQTGRGVTMASDMYSYGLLFIYTFGGAGLLVLHDIQALAKTGISPEQEIVTRHFCYFGPVVPEGLLKQVDNEDWYENLKQSSASAERILKKNPNLSFQSWGSDLRPSTANLISGLTNLDPAARLTIKQALEHPMWHEAV